MRDTQWRPVLGAARCEFRMQRRRISVWIAPLALGLAQLAGSLDLLAGSSGQPLAVVIPYWASSIQMYLPIAVGVLLADRLVRDRRMRVGELLDTLPASVGGRLWGKYLGSTLATILPVFLVYAAGVGYALLDRRDPEAVSLGLAAFATINLPGLLFVAAFSIAVPAVLSMPLYQFLFVGYWFWGNLLDPNSVIPSLSGTLLTPVGGYMMAAFFGVEGPGVHQAAIWQGIASMLLLLGAVIGVLMVGLYYLKWERERE